MNNKENLPFAGLEQAKCANEQIMQQVADNKQIAVGMTEEASQMPSAPSVTRTSLWAVATQLSMTLLGAATSIILNRTLGQDGRGAVALGMLWALLLGGLAGAGWVPALGCCISRCPEMSRAYWSAAQLTGLAISAITFSLGWLAIPWLMSDSPELWHMGRWLLLTIPLTLSGQASVAGMEALHRFDLSSQIRVGNLVGILFFLVPLAFMQALTPWTYCAAFLITVAMNTAYSILLFAKASSGSWLPQWKPLPSFVLRAAPLNWTQAMQLRADQFMIALLAPVDPSAFGAYVVGTTLAGMVSPIAQGLALVLLPESARRAEADFVQLFMRMSRFFILAASGLALPVAIMAPWLLKLLYGAEFTSAAYALRVGLVTVVLAGLFSMGLNTVLGAGRPGKAALIGFICCLFSVAASVLMLPLLGYVGAAFGQALGFVVGLYLICVVYRSEGITLLSFLPGASDVISIRTFAKRFFGRRPLAPALPASDVNEQSPSLPDGEPVFLEGGR